MPKKSTKNNVWKPTTHQQRLLETYAKTEKIGNIEALCKEADVDKGVYYKAMGKPEFVTLWEDIRFKRFKRFGDVIDLAVVKAAIRDGKENAAMARIFYEKTGELTRDESPAPSTIVINISHE
jgi:hypothetical protein